ncbi:MAG: 6-carboxytetrahydropterin synthase [Rickettsiales bacterium]
METLNKTLDNLSITIKIEFDAGHRVIGHEYKCKFLHGHRYILLISFKSNNLNEIGFIEDFSILKKTIKNWIDENFDHTCILSEKDKELGTLIVKNTGQKIFYLDQNPTVENILIYLSQELPIIVKKIPNNNFLVISSLELFETPNCSAKINL